MDIKVDLSGLQQFDGLAAQIEQAQEQALDVGAKYLLDQKTAEIAKTYRRIIPKGKSGKPKWERSGDFQGGQRIESTTGERLINTEGNAAKYEARLADLPTGPDGINRTNAAAPNAVKASERVLPRVIESEIKNALNL